MKHALLQLGVDQIGRQVDGPVHLAHATVEIALGEKHAAQNIPRQRVVGLSNQNQLRSGPAVIEALLAEQGLGHHEPRLGIIRLAVENGLKLVEGQLIIRQMIISQAKKIAPGRIGHLFQGLLQLSHRLGIILLGIEYQALQANAGGMIRVACRQISRQLPGSLDIPAI